MKTRETIWVVTEVWRGIPIAAHAYRDPEQALICEQKMRARINPIEDETGIFEVPLDVICDDQG